MTKVPKQLKLIDAYMQRAKIMLTIIRDHIATLIVVINSIKSPDTIEDAAVTRLENHKALLNKMVKSPEYIHNEPIAPFDLIWTTNELCASTVLTLLRANTLSNSNKTFNRYKTALLQKNPSLIDRFYKKKALTIGPLILEWNHIFQMGKSLENIHETLWYLLENINTESDKYHTPISPASLVPSEAPQET